MNQEGTDPTILAGRDDLTGTTIGRFHITALLGKGGMGEVYLAEDSLLKRSVALKRVSATLRSNPQYRELLVREAERASRLNDEHVAHIHDVFEDRGELFLVMEYVEGESLRKRCESRISLNEFLPLATQCTEALVAAYQSGIIHRDIKPENIMITRKGRVKICDFGLARQGAWIEETTLVDGTPIAGFQGTPAYMAPEALLNREPDFRADMFSLGVTFYELLAGRHPFREEKNPMATADRIIHATPTSLRDIDPTIPRALCDIVMKMLEKHRADRYAAPSELLEALSAIKPVPAPVRRIVSWRTVAALFVVSAVALAAFINSRSRPEGTGGGSTQRNLVVLPFRAIGQDIQTRSYSDGLTETLTARLSRASTDLQVIPATEVRTRRVTSAAEARKQFGANLILTGTLYQSSTEMRLTYSLYESATLRQLKADTIAAVAANASALELQVFESVLSALNVPRSPDSSAASSVPQAQDLYIQGRGYLQDVSDDNRLQVAMQAFQRAKDLDPGYATAYAALGEAYWAKYQSTKEVVWVGLAREACEKADELNPKSADAKVCLGTVNLGSGQFERSIGDFESALDSEPVNDAATLGLAGAYERIGNSDAAEKTFRRAIQLRPNYYLGYMRLGQYYLRHGRYADAADQFQKEISIVPNGDQAYLRIGAAYIYLNRYEDAITVLRKSIELRPTAGAYSNLGSTYLRLRRFDDAVPVFEQAVNLVPRNHVIAGNLARAYHWSSGQKSKAQSTYDRAVQLALDELAVNARNSDAHILISRYYAMLGKKTEALNHLTNALILQPADAEYHSIAAVVHNQFGNRQAALAALRKALSIGWSTTSIDSEIEFDNLRMDPEFKKLMEG